MMSVPFVLNDNKNEKQNFVTKWILNINPFKDQDSAIECVSKVFAKEH